MFPDNYKFGSNPPQTEALSRELTWSGERLLLSCLRREGLGEPEELLELELRDVLELPERLDAEEELEPLLEPVLVLEPELEGRAGPGPDEQDAGVVGNRGRQRFSPRDEPARAQASKKSLSSYFQASMSPSSGRGDGISPLNPGQNSRWGQETAFT